MLTRTGEWALSAGLPWCENGERWWGTHDIPQCSILGLRASPWVSIKPAAAQKPFFLTPECRGYFSGCGEWGSYSCGVGFSRCCSYCKHRLQVHGRSS